MGVFVSSPEDFAVGEEGAVGDVSEPVWGEEEPGWVMGVGGFGAVELDDGVDWLAVGLVVVEFFFGFAEAAHEDLFLGFGIFTVEVGVVLDLAAFVALTGFTGFDVFATLEIEPGFKFAGGGHFSFLLVVWFGLCCYWLLVGVRSAARRCMQCLGLIIVQTVDQETSPNSFLLTSHRTTSIKWISFLLTSPC